MPREGGRPLTVHGLWLKEEPTDTAKGEFTVNGVISALSSTSISVSVEGRTEPARCLVPPTANVSGFAVGDVVELQCHLSGGAWGLAALKSERAVIAEDGSASFTVQGVLSEKSSSFIGVTVERHPDAVRCAVPTGADLAAFAVGDVVEMHCHYRGGFMLASLKSSTASLVLEEG